MSSEELLAQDWRRLYDGLLSMKPDGTIDDPHVRLDLIIIGFLENREVKKPCRTCETPQTDYRYDKITMAGRMFMDVVRALSKDTAGE